MPHDKNGQLLAVGDAVIIAAVVASITTGEEFCNVTLETIEPMFPGDHRSSITLNSKQVEKPLPPASTEALALPEDAGAPDEMPPLPPEPVPAELPYRRDQPDHIEQFFAFAHLPEHLQSVSKPFAALAELIVYNIPRNPERTVALRKLLEAKDAAVRAVVAKK